MRPKGQISPLKLGRNTTYSAKFYHPELKRRVTRGLGTRNEVAARRICDGLEFLCANPAATAAEFRDRDARAWAIFHKESKLLEVDKPGLIDIAREIFPEIKPDDMARALPFVSDEKGTHSTLIESLPSIAKLVALLQRQSASKDTFKALTKLLGELGGRGDAERNKRKFLEAELNAQNYSEDHERSRAYEEYAGTPERPDFETELPGVSPEFVKKFRENKAALQAQATAAQPVKKKRGKKSTTSENSK